LKLPFDRCTRKVDLSMGVVIAAAAAVVVDVEEVGGACLASDGC
jgi:hypothetical protein